jgi:HAD superfamily hydrolase (TIGR01509 family)
MSGAALGDIELVIFDCDGVLVDSEPISTRVLAEALTAHGLQTSPEQALGEYKGRLLSDIDARAHQRLGRALPAGWGDAFEQERARVFERELQPVAGAAEALERVKSAGLAVCVASQGKVSKTRLTLGLTGLRELIPDEALFSAYSVARGKPYPDLFLHAAHSMGATPTRCVVVEDTSLGVTAAVAAGMRALGYAAERGGDEADAAALSAAGAEVFGSLVEVPALLGIAG